MKELLTIREISEIQGIPTRWIIKLIKAMKLAPAEFKEERIHALLRLILAKQIELLKDIRVK
ncbi:MAG: hypothetical protein ACP5FZ_12030 [Fidelibacterota bacterium]